MVQEKKNDVIATEINDENGKFNEQTADFVSHKINSIQKNIQTLTVYMTS